MKVSPDALLIRPARRYHRHRRQRQSQCEDQEAPPPHRFAISSTRLSIVASIIRLDCA
jgi:hypothetical protein